MNFENDTWIEIPGVNCNRPSGFFLLGPKGCWLEMWVGWGFSIDVLIVGCIDLDGPLMFR